MQFTDYCINVQLSHLLATDIGFSGIEALIIDTLYATNEEITYNNIERVIESNFQIVIDMAKITKALKILSSENKIYTIGNTITLSPEVKGEVDRMVNQNQQLENDALNEWINSFKTSNHYDFSEEDFDTLKLALIKYIKNFLIRHGADSFSLLSGETKSQKFDIKLLVDESANDIPPDLKENFKIFLLTLFSKVISHPQKDYCNYLINKATSYLSTVADNDINEMIIEQLKDITIYLDTPILYRLLNLQGQSRFNAVKSLVDNCNKNNIKLKILQCTFDELKRRISYDAKVILKHPTPRSFSEIGYNCRTSDNYISTFWAANKETGISAEDFNFKFSNLKSLIEDEVNNIEIDTNDYLSELNLDNDVKNIIIKVREYSSKDPDYIKSPNSIEHDAQCIAIIEKLRLPNSSSAINGKTIFLSSDWSLLKLQRYDYDYKDKVDFILLPSQIMQLFCITHSTESFYETFLGMFSSSKTYFGAKSLSNRNIQEILGRIAMYSGATPNFAQKVLSNQIIQNTFSEKESEEEQLKVIDDAILFEIEEMEKDLRLKTDKIVEIQVDNLTKEDKIQDLNKRIEILEDSQQKHYEEIQGKNAELSKYESHYKRSSENKSKVKAIVRYIGGIILFILGLLSLIICIFAIIPSLSLFVEPFFNWINNSIIIKNEVNNNIGIISFLIAFAVPSISGGLKMFIPGYKSLKEMYYKKYIDKI